MTLFIKSYKLCLHIKFRVMVPDICQTCESLRRALCCQLIYNLSCPWGPIIWFDGTWRPFRIRQIGSVALASGSQSGGWVPLYGIQRYWSGGAVQIIHLNCNIFYLCYSGRTAPTCTCISVWEKQFVGDGSFEHNDRNKLFVFMFLALFARTSEGLLLLLVKI